MANTFSETVAIDIKHYKGKILLHIVDHFDHCTRLSIKFYHKQTT